MIHQQHSDYSKQNNLSDENQKKKLNFEPFLIDRRYHFKEIFISTDISLNGSSLIQPIKLAIPKKPKQKAQINMEVNEPIDNSNQVTNASDNIPQTTKDDQINDIQNQNNNIPLENDKVPEITNTNYTNANLENKVIKLSQQNLFDPIPLGSISIFHMKIEKKNPVSVVPVEDPKETICTISKESKKRSLVYKISVNQNVVANVTMLSHDSFYSTLNTNDGQCEISALTILKQNKEIKIRQFQAFFPPKEQTINFNGSPVLLKADTNKIEMGPRPPKMKRGIPVMYFGGRVKKESTQNFILETHNDGCAHFVFGKVDDETYVGEVYPPLSPLQAISIALPHFK